jgi:hypothetical protein
MDQKRNIIQYGAHGAFDSGKEMDLCHLSEPIILLLYC